MLSNRKPSALQRNAYIQKTQTCLPETDLPFQTPNPPATGELPEQPRVPNTYYCLFKINILNFPSLLKVSACGSRSSVKQ
ncbi:hypothetical protein AMECASPLE_015014 [Ameca splendens]|uniref:Uncharacterized protein n=1 Tax=Ameca splendens TaxID=208324 RepID=A0ABV0YZR4_9TELE